MSIDKVAYWKELADYDIETAEVMFVAPSEPTGKGLLCSKNFVVSRLKGVNV